MKRTLLLLTTALAVFLCASCGLLPPLAGNGSEITNGCCIISRTGKPADSAMVIAIPQGYVPVPGIANKAFPETTFTDTNGSFSLVLDHGAWNLLIYDHTETYGAFVPLYRLAPGDSIMIDSLGFLQGTSYDSLHNSVGIRGSPFFAYYSPGYTFSIGKIPPFTYTVEVWYGLGCYTDPVSGQRICPSSSSRSHPPIGLWLNFGYFTDPVSGQKIYPPAVVGAPPPQRTDTAGTITINPGKGANINIGP
jgi:hypothetical protein